ncbi:MAG: 30S ribosomal protein S6e [Candidatus Parvarchaeota archaeon]|nr:30S ribosomal protein S6e [Candidatus Jingweiarchaeum tengchongense]MCW1300284.1 30S ribosomal protein S6e [Candidatus Jingweiarchaeum tengchongense]MCW1304480.1 30S ribosomal protein S6e [Candidatus Jingweiarchaeum tengchongense]MCW1305790.1 30S ribosomal protein S6e [Candidatus Jingweiarchaeum tengchongense]MCW1309991.1 30S ribosomal protein S6e [Candidatus Jingweiarchaeum tengchongense]
MKIVISDPKSGKSFQRELSKEEEEKLYGKKIGEIVKGEVLNLPGYELQITGGSDKSGFPMRSDVHGSRKVKVLLSSPPGFKPRKKGERRRKSVRGNVVSAEIVQLNTKVVKEGEKKLDEIFVKKEGEGVQKEE